MPVVHAPAKQACGAGEENPSIQQCHLQNAPHSQGRRAGPSSSRRVRTNPTREDKGLAIQLIFTAAWRRRTLPHGHACAVQLTRPACPRSLQPLRAAATPLVVFVAGGVRLVEILVVALGRIESLGRKDRGRHAHVEAPGDLLLRCLGKLLLLLARRRRWRCGRSCPCRRTGRPDRTGRCCARTRRAAARRSPSPRRISPRPPRNARCRRPIRAS